MNTQSECGPIRGTVRMPDQWTVFAPVPADAPVPDVDMLAHVPEVLSINGTRFEAHRVQPVRDQYDFRTFFGPPLTEAAFGHAAYVFVPVEVEQATEVTFGVGGDHRVQAWVNGKPVLGEGEPVTDLKWPPSIENMHVIASLTPGVNVLAVRFIGGKGSSVLAIGGPNELRRGAERSVLVDPMTRDPRWTRPGLQAKPGDKPCADIGSRLGLFVDDFLIDAMAGAAERRLHSPVPRDIIMHLDRPWEGSTGGCFSALVRDDKRVLLYYRGHPLQHGKRVDRSENQVTCIAESDDGVTFTRPELGICEFDGSTANNIIWHGKPAHNFAPFIDPNPDAQPDQRFKAIAYHPTDHGLGAFASADGYHWRLLADHAIITKGDFDSHNLAFYDPNSNQYVSYNRINTGGLRRIQRCTSADFIHWTEPEEIAYTDPHLWQMYTNNIGPYFRAPHIYLGMPARYVPEWKKDPTHHDHGISDAILISSRDGRTFDRWEEAFIRPGLDLEVWTDRNNYPARGMIQTSPAEISIYWSEHYKHPTNRLRRGTIRTDGFVSIHVGGNDVGEILTRPITFTGEHLQVNYATSAVGSVRFELCDLSGEALDGFSLLDSDVLFGNEITHTVTWRGRASLTDLAGTAIRLRIRLHDADLFSMRFSR